MNATRCVFPALLASVAFAQTAARHEFEVASIRPSAPATPGVRMAIHIDGAQVTYKYASLKDLIQSAYDLKTYQVVCPDFAASDRYDIAAKVPAEGGRGHIREMLQSLLEDRFKMKYHRESKEFPVYRLVVAKGGLKLKESPAEDANVADKGNVNVGVSGGANGVNVDFGKGSYFSFANNKLEAGKIEMGRFAEMLARFMDRPVVDMTGAKGRYDIKLDFTPEDYQAMLIRSAVSAGVALPPQALKLMEMGSGDSLGAALQLVGLKLDSRKAPLPVLIVDQMEKTPSEN